MKTALIFLMLIFSSLCFATDEFQSSDISDYDYNSIAFKNTFALCSEIKTTQQNLQVNGKMLQFFFTGVKSGAKLWGPDAIQLTSETARLIQSDGFKAALYRCYGDNIIWHRAFTATVMFDDAVGHLVGFGVWLIPASYLARIFKIATVALTNPEWAATMGRTFGVVQKGALLAFVSYVGWNEYTKYENRKNQSEEFTKLTDSMVDATKSQSDETHRILQVLLNQVNSGLAQNPNEATKEKLLRRKALLKNQIYHPPTASLGKR